MLEQAVSSALYRLTLLEKALYSADPWYLSVDSEHHRADREMMDNGVVFRARFDTRHIDVPMVSLWCGDELVGAQPLSISDNDRSVEVAWAISLGSEAVAA
jgi:hypothetical protein